ncbi:putative NADH-ubiquinone reductase complex 1 MLRQ subunit [Helianthus anomalus]
MPQWMRPEVYPLMAAMTFVTGMCVFQLTRNVFMNPDARVNKVHRTMGVLENHDEGQKYAEHGLRRFLRTRPPEVMPNVNSFFSNTK